MSTYSTEQEKFWAGEFGDQYIERNTFETLPNRIALFTDILRSTRGVKSFLELGANIGINLCALKQLAPDATYKAVEINKKAYDQLRQNEWIEAYNGSLFDNHFDEQVNFTFTSGVLIHIHPDFLPQAYKALYDKSSRYVMVCEYFNPSPVEVSYRGHSERLYKRDFAGEMLDQYKDLSLVDYGFVYQRDPNFPTDNMSWFLMEKR